MALGSVAISGGMSKKEKERMMYMDGKLVWSAAMGASSSMSTTAPAEADYIVVKPMALAFTSSIAYSQQKTARVARGGSGHVSWMQHSKYNSSVPSSYYAKVTFSAEGNISIYYPQDNSDDYCTVEGYHYY